MIVGERFVADNMLLLAALKKAGRWVTAANISGVGKAAGYDIALATRSTRLKKMEKLGLVERHPQPGRHRNLWNLTLEGERQLKEFHLKLSRLSREPTGSFDLHQARRKLLSLRTTVNNVVDELEGSVDPRIIKRLREAAQYENTSGMR